MKRNSLFTQNPDKHISIKKILSLVTAAIMLVMLFAVPNPFVLAYDEAPINLIANAIPSEIFKASRDNYNTKVTSGTLKFDGTETFYCSSDYKSNNTIKSYFKKLTDKDADTDLSIAINDTNGYSNPKSSALVLVYDLGKNANISKIQLTSTKMADRQVAGYDCYISTSYDDLLDISNQVYTSHGNELTEDETAFDANYDLPGREVTVNLNGNVKQGQYVAIVITRPTPISGKTDNIARITEISVYGTPAKEQTCDVNNDGEIDIRDLVCLKKLLINPENTIDMDLNGDKITDVSDLAYLRKTLLQS